jgi:hypothetical protein
MKRCIVWRLGVPYRYFWWGGDGIELEILKAEFVNVEKTRSSAEQRQILTSRQDVTSQRTWNFILAVFLYLNHESVCVCVCVCVYVCVRERETVKVP